MKHLRKFNSVTAMNTALASATINILGLAYDSSTPVMRIKSGGSPVPPAPDPTEPFYIDVRGAVTLAATSGLQMSTDTAKSRTMRGLSSWEILFWVWLQHLICIQN